MERARFKTGIINEMEKLISASSVYGRESKKMKPFHEAIIKKHYNASDVKIDYNRHRINMHVILDEGQYRASSANVGLSVMPVNLFFKNLSDFLKSCIGKDKKDLGFYSNLIKKYSKPKHPQLSGCL